MSPNGWILTGVSVSRASRSLADLLYSNISLLWLLGISFWQYLHPFDCIRPPLIDSTVLVLHLISACVDCFDTPVPGYSCVSKMITTDLTQKKQPCVTVSQPFSQLMPFYHYSVGMLGKRCGDQTPFACKFLEFFQGTLSPLLVNTVSRLDSPFLVRLS